MGYKGKPLKKSFNNEQISLSENESKNKIIFSKTLENGYFGLKCILSLGFYMAISRL